MASAVEFFTTKVGCSTFKALWSLSIGPALGMCLFTKISYQNKAPAGWVNKNHQLKPYSIAIYTLPHVWVKKEEEPNFYLYHLYQMQFYLYIYLYYTSTIILLYL